MMVGVVFFQNKWSEIFTIKNIKRHILIDIMFLKVTIYKIQ